MACFWRSTVVLAGLLGALNAGVSAAADEHTGTTVDLSDFKSTTPPDWKPVATRSDMRAYQFRIPHAKSDKEDGELIVFWFNGQGGSADANVKRWKSMFQPPEGKTIDEVSKVRQLKLADRKVEATYLDVRGTYRFKFPPFAPNAKEQVRPDYRMLAVVFETPKGPYFIRLVGPQKTIADHTKEFEHWLKAFK